MEASLQEEEASDFDFGVLERRGRASDSQEMEENMQGVL